MAHSALLIVTRADAASAVISAIALICLLGLFGLLLTVSLRRGQQRGHPVPELSSALCGTPAHGVARGVAFLDVHGPVGWPLIVDLDRLTIGSPDYGSLAQLHGTYLRGLMHYGDRLDDTGVAFGFTFRMGARQHADIDALDAEWHQRLTECLAVMGKVSDTDRPPCADFGHGLARQA